jgi:hypothetical protein
MRCVFAVTLSLLLALSSASCTLAPEIEERVRKASAEQLDVWAERVLSAASLQEVLDG